MAISTLYPSSRPSLSIDFAKSKKLDPRISFSRTHTGSIASYTDANGLIRFAGPDAPRFDHDPATGESLGLLLEESRTNLVLYSEDASQWAKSLSEVSPNETTAPDGTLTADLVTDTETSGNHYVTASLGTLSDNVDVILSVYLKANTTNFARLRFSNKVGTGCRAWFDLSNGTTTSVDNGCTASITSAGNGWYKCTLIDNSNTGAFVPTLQVFVQNATGSQTTYDGDGSSVYVWGAQVEQGTFATSYIPTSGSAITRPGDAVTMEVGPEDNKLSIQDFNSNGEGTLLCEFTDSDGVGSNVATAFSAGTHNGGSFLAIGSNSKFEPFIRNRVNGTNEALLSESSLDTSVGFVKVGFIIDQNFNKIVTSSGVLEDTSVSYETDPYSKLIIGRDQIVSDNNRIFGSIKKITFYSSSLSVSNLQTLTK
jgi:hypothetical protein